MGRWRVLFLLAAIGLALATPAVSSTSIQAIPTTAWSVDEPVRESSSNVWRMATVLDER